jgi:hypothetical protein
LVVEPDLAADAAHREWNAFSVVGRSPLARGAARTPARTHSKQRGRASPEKLRRLSRTDGAADLRSARTTAGRMLPARDHLKQGCKQNSTEIARVSPGSAFIRHESAFQKSPVCSRDSFENAARRIVCAREIAPGLGTALAPYSSSKKDRNERSTDGRKPRCAGDL